MDNVVGLLAVAALYGSVLAALVWLAAKVRRSRVGGGLMGPFEQMWHPEGHQFRIEIEQLAERGVSTPSPDDDDGSKHSATDA